MISSSSDAVYTILSRSAESVVSTSHMIRLLVCQPERFSDLETYKPSAGVQSIRGTERSGCTTQPTVYLKRDLFSGQKLM